jgi:hypothetical protein
MNNIGQLRWSARSTLSGWTAVMAITLATLLWPPTISSAVASEPKMAVITFSGLWNGINPYTNYAVLHRPLPSTYQPLMEAEPFTKPVDGANFGIRIGWDNAHCSNHGLNRNVKDHTGDAVTNNGSSNQELGGGIMFAEGPCTMTFSRPIEIPSLFWTFYEPATQPVLKNGTIAVFRNVDDTTPLKSVEVPYHDSQGYVWRQMTSFAGLKISKIVFDPRDQDTGLNIDDITVLINENN